MAISLRLGKNLERELERCARAEGVSKSELIRTMISAFVSQRSSRPTPWELGKELFGREGSGLENLSKDRKRILKEKLRVSKSHH